MKALIRNIVPLAFLFLLVSPAFLLRADSTGSWRFDFGSGPVANGYITIQKNAVFSETKGYGIEPGFEAVEFLRRYELSPTKSDGLTGNGSLFFSCRVPEGNYRVRVTLGSPQYSSTTTIRAELRRLLAASISVPARESRTVEFIVNRRSPQIEAKRDIDRGVVELKAPRETTQEAWAWDDLLTLEFTGERPSVCSIEIEPIDVPTLFLIGDSTVCDQSREPYTSWGQMLTVLFKPEIAVANHGESGETYRDSIGRRRLDKILSVMKPDDYLFMQFGHNDQKQIASGNGGPFTTYKQEMAEHVSRVQSRGGIPVVLSPMERNSFDEDGNAVQTLGDYSEAARQVAEEMDVAFIDLNGPSRAFYEALESEGSGHSLAAFAPGDKTHHNNYGAYQIAKIVAQGIVDNDLEIAAMLSDDFEDFYPSEPDPLARFNIPPSPMVAHVRPLGD